MSSLDRLPPDPGHAKPFCPTLGAPQRPAENPCHHNTKGFKAFPIDRHLQPPLHGGEDGIKPGRGASQVVLNSRQPVSPSPVFREGTMHHNSGIAGELQRLVFDAAGEIKPGMGIKSQMNAACDNLGYARGDWRVRSAWYGNAKNWRSEPVFDMLGRYNRLVQKRTASGSHSAPAADPFSNLMMGTGRG